MLKAKSFLAIDCGASTLKLAEFDLNEQGGLRLRQFATASLGLQGAQESTRESVTLAALQEMLGSGQFTAKQVHLCAPGYHVFSRFVKLPPVDAAKVEQIVKYEAQQNVPFPLEEVVWDYQILGTTAGGELEVLLVALKTDIAEGLHRIIESAGLRLQMVDVSPGALINAFRFNYSDLTGCTMLLDIGARTSNLLFFEKGKVFARSINIGGNMITQEFANEFRLRFEEAERLKIEKGFVSLGGAYEEPDDPQAAAISKIARQVMTRLHMQMNQTINYYKQNQGGAAPDRLLLSGGVSVMPYAAQFFAEKLNLREPGQVDYFNPLRNIAIDPGVNLEELQKVAHTMGEQVGLGLRNLAHCPVEINLMPRSSQAMEEFNRKKPFILAALFSLALVFLAVGVLQQKIVDVKRDTLDKLTVDIQPLSAAQNNIEQEKRLLRELVEDADLMKGWLEMRTYWADLLGVLRECLMATETSTRQMLKTDTGIWIEDIALGDASAGQHATMAMPVGGPRRRGLRSWDSIAGGQSTPVAPIHDPVTGEVLNKEAVLAGMSNAMPAEVSITHLTLKIRAVDMTPVDPAGNTTVAYEFLKQLQNHPQWFDTNPAATNATAFKSTITVSSNTFQTELLVKLKRPIPF